MLQPRDNSCVILFGIPNYVVQFAEKVFTGDTLTECEIILDPSHGHTLPVNIVLKETFAALSVTGRRRELKFPDFTSTL